MKREWGQNGEERREGRVCGGGKSRGRNEEEETRGVNTVKHDDKQSMYSLQGNISSLNNSYLCIYLYLCN